MKELSGRVYTTGIDSWRHGERSSPVDWHTLLGPCPICGHRTFDYGGGWRCVDRYCANSANNPAPTVGPAPTWWDTDVNVFRDGSDWCAVRDGFVNLMESDAGFGATPGAAVEALTKAESSAVTTSGEG